MSGWLITGASGFLAANLGLVLQGSATRVGVSRSPAPASSFDVVFPVDLLDHRAMEDIVRTTRPRIIVHTAAVASHEACEAEPNRARQINAVLPGQLATLAAEAGARFIHISTDAVFSGTRGGYRETDDPEPFSLYGETKLVGEQAVLEANPAALVVRTNFFGWSPSGTRSILEFFVNAMRSETQVCGFTDYVVTSIYARDLASTLHHLVATTDARGLVHVASRDARSKYQFSQDVAQAFDLDPGLVTPASAMSADETSRARDLSLDTSRLQMLMGRMPPSQAEGIAAACKDEASYRLAWRT